MGEAALLAAVSVAAGLVACLGTRALIPLLQSAAVLDRPNARSLHATPVPRGGGIAVVVAILLAWLGLILAGLAAPRLLAVLLGTVLLAAVSWRDDLRSLPPGVRLIAQCVALGLVLGTLALIGAQMPSQGRLPLWLDATATGLVWLWFANLFNFMDGIDGLAGSEAAAIALGLVVFATFGTDHDTSFAALAAPIAAAAIGFLVWNWAPARIFLGDVGSIPLGYLLGFLLLGVAASGHWKIALILPLYFLADATITLLRRLFRGERVWTPHRTHFYQRAVTRGLSHAAVVRRVIAANILLIGLGWAAENGWGNIAVALAAIVVAALLLSLTGLRRRGVRPIPAAKPRIGEPPA
jgi:UDP-N-acetylmuramyl pentapeptide phosphotransferase/UDP-N-acetylglucosamine-1-phosphate transferase